MHGVERPLRAQVRQRAAVTSSPNSGSGKAGSASGAAARPSPFTSQTGAVRSGEGRLCPSHLCSLFLCLTSSSSPLLWAPGAPPRRGAVCAPAHCSRGTPGAPWGQGSKPPAGLTEPPGAVVASSACSGKHFLEPKWPLLTWGGHRPRGPSDGGRCGAQPMRSLRDQERCGGQRGKWGRDVPERRNRGV